MIDAKVIDELYATTVRASICKKCGAPRSPEGLCLCESPIIAALLKGKEIKVKYA